MFIHSQTLNPCKCGSTKKADLDSDDVSPCWGVNCYACGQFQHGPHWDMQGAVTAWNEANPVKEKEVTSE